MSRDIPKIKEDFRALYKKALTVSGLTLGSIKEKFLNDVDAYQYGERVFKDIGDEQITIEIDEVEVVQNTTVGGHSGPWIKYNGRVFKNGRVTDIKRSFIDEKCDKSGISPLLNRLEL